MKEQLCIDIEKSLGKRLCTPKDFEMLRERIYNRLHILISTTTIKRVWGYLHDDVQTRQSTFDILAKFIGYQDYKDYTNNHIIYKEEIQSSPVISRKLNVAEELIQGDRLRIIWQPGRICEITYQGNLTFSVSASQNTRIIEGDTFECSLLIEGEPLYIDNLRQGNRPPIAYVCGKKSGILFERITENKGKEE